MKKVLLLLAVCVFLPSCASMYIKPQIQPVLFEQQVPGGSDIIFKAALKVLPMLGYNLQGSDASAGTITTAPMKLSINPEQCDCGTAMGLPLVKSEGVKADVSFILAVTDNKLAIKADVVPELDDIMSTLAAAGVTYTCISKGGLEKVLADQFVEKMKTSALQLLFDNIKF
ncbi:MAG TPA: hypothetical protein PLB12_00870 [Candidatus Goldiibacteriota bacterium]|nr:hypothetical protein [Candidatus Goldiibacteriota bacterium]HPI04151.1 hypothetical protein [Candidatus Goldiibacteriota bacterium]HRQ42885.1 hypothetical protein [Candidatus Goldiibacteriota bacterium]